MVVEYKLSLMLSYIASRLRKSKLVVKWLACDHRLMRLRMK